MSAMLIHYAATGNPNHPGLPAWHSYDLKERYTMIWETTPHIEKDPRGEERRYAAASPYRQPGTYEP
jgi:para-nitrobenzyl esterase